MINPTNKEITDQTLFTMRDEGSAMPYMLDEESVQQFDLFNLVLKAHDYTQRRGIPYADVTLIDLQDTYRMLGNMTPQELAEWVEAVLEVELTVIDE
ncbi:MAG: hypothetical protein NC218_03375 [Acetobacter sp.]|nr:hypothetical protein [Acetobacter sp.]